MATPLIPGTHTVNLDVVPQLVDFLADKGVKGLFIGGTTGEGTQLDLDQREALHAAAAAAAAGRVAVLLHVGAQRADDAVRLARQNRGGQPAPGLIAPGLLSSRRKPARGAAPCIAALSGLRPTAAQRKLLPPPGTIAFADAFRL